MMPMNVPILLTWLRIALIPLFVISFYLPFPGARPIAAFLFTMAGLTDWLDGYLARRLGQTSAFGAFLDPVADKLMVAVALVLIVQTDPRLVIALAAATIIGREITISALREWMAGAGAGARIAVSWVAKIKTTVQIVALVMMIYRDTMWGVDIYQIGAVLLVVAAVLTLWSMFTYVRAAWPTLMDADTGASS